jgi:CubicO group peptidase (beta-lactamase class C family)
MTWTFGPALLLAAAVAPAPWAQTTAQLDRYVTAVAGLGRFNGVVLVARGDAKYVTARGYADVARRVKNVADTQFEIASLTKMFTAAAILKLRDAGKLRLADSICTYLAPCPAAWKPVTIDEVLHHRSGIPDYEDALGMESPAYYAFMTAPDDARRILDREMPLPLDFPPGTKFSYTNTGYVALGYVVEKAAGLPYATFLHRTLFEPAGMRDSGVIGVDDAPRLAIGYQAPHVDWPQRLVGYRLADVAPQPVPRLALAAPHGDASVFSSAGDLLRWARIMQGSDAAIESPAERAEILQATDGYGDGWMVADAFDQQRFRHTGELPGFLSTIAVFPQSATSVVVLENVDLPISAIVRDIQALALGQPYDLPFSGPMVTLTAQRLAPLTGQYALDGGDIACVAISKGALEVAIKGKYTAGLMPFAADRFYMPLSSGPVTFSGSPPTSMNLRYNGVDHQATRVDRACPDGTTL